MEPNLLQRNLKRIELATRRAFIRLLSLRSEKTQPKLPLELDSTPTIVFLRQDRLGDAIITTPLLTALNAKYPNGRFIMLLGKNNIGIRELLPIECEVHIYRKRIFRDIIMLRKLRRRKIDVVIDLMDNPSATSSMLVAALSPRFSIGIEKDNSTSYNIRVPLLDRSQYHIGRRIAELLRPLGIDPEVLSLKPVLKSVNITPVPGRIGFNLSAGTPDRYLTPATNRGIMEGLLSYNDVKEIVLFSHPKDRAAAESLLSEIHSARAALAPMTHTFKAFAEQITSCELLITPDTSAVHLASAFGIPLVAMYLPQPPTLHYWTPTGVPYEMIVHGPTLATLSSDEVLRAFASLHTRLGLKEALITAQAEYVA
ncbi:MAG TPA: glycosyltransferase family 9 protein [Candidatus Kapabacteria bacterium]|nr:glycosyltransferase family 9 protein [Candidatus Kapabacteria bacterium]